MFRILLVDDDPGTLFLMRRVLQSMKNQPELYFAKDGMDALDFLYRRGIHEDSPRPSLIILDLQMPRLNGVETCSAIKADNDLSVIPIIILSTLGSRHEVKRSYHARANCFVQKPTSLEEYDRFGLALEAFWLNVALLPPG